MEIIFYKYIIFGNNQFDQEIKLLLEMAQFYKKRLLQKIVYMIYGNKPEKLS